MQAMDNHRKGLNEKSEKKEEPVSLEGIIRLIKKFVMLLGQASIFSSWNISSMPLYSKSEVIGILNPYASLLSIDSTRPFDCQFRRQELDNTKA